MQGYWRRDHAFMRAYGERSRTRAGFLEWLEEWVLGVEDRAAYLRRLGDREALAVRHHRLSAPVDYGDE